MTACATLPKDATLRTTEAISTFTSSTYRAANKDDMFKTEFQNINKRRKIRGSARADLPLGQKTLGLALSGGGIRSNAFQLGILGGLHEAEFLTEVDYISAVSGGSWAATAYKVGRCQTGSAPMDERKNNMEGQMTVYTRYIDHCSDKTFFVQLDNAAQGHGYGDPKKIHPCPGPDLCSDGVFSRETDTMTVYRYDSQLLLSSYSEIAGSIKKSLVVTDPLDLDKGFTTREAWRRMLKKHFLFNNDVPLSGLERAYPEKPVTIINATHDDTSGLLSSGPITQRENFPFQLTADSIGTIADCGNTKYCFLQRYAAHSTHGPVFLNMQHEDAPPLYLSHAIAMSSGVSPAKIFGMSAGLLQWDVEFPVPADQRGKDDDPFYRTRFSLSDGGHSENLGALPLLERGVDLIILSDDDADTGYAFDDFYTMAYHAKKLLNTDIFFNENHLHGIRDGLSYFYKDEFNNDAEAEALFKQIEQAYGPTKPRPIDPTIDTLRLNDVLRETDFYSRWNQKTDKKKIHGNAEVNQLISDTRDFRTMEFDKLDADIQKKIILLNRLLIEASNTNAPKNQNFMLKGTYAGAANKDGRIILIKPPRMTHDFKRFLLGKQDKDAKAYYEVYNYLEVNKKDVSFPVDATMKESYAPSLINAYYLLGKYISTKNSALAKELQQWLSGDRKPYTGETTTIMPYVPTDVRPTE